MTMRRKNGSRSDHLGLQGKVEIWAYRGKKLFYHEIIKNIILQQGDAAVIMALTTSSPAPTPRIITRMAIGDQGTIPSDSTVPKVPVATLTSLYHEVYRQDIDSATPTISGPTNECQFVTTFTSGDIALSAYSNPSQPQVNELGLIVIDPTAPAGIVRAPVTAPTAPPSDEVLFSIRTFKTIPFDAADDVTITARYTISVM
jgi:hypothetical protein